MPHPDEREREAKLSVEQERPRPDLNTEEGRLAFNRILNDRLPTKRAIAQGVLRSTSGAILLCQLTYKKDWDLPGGVVDPGESPKACLAREIREELGVDLTPTRLLATNWLPPFRGWDDAVLFLFDLGRVELSFADGLTLMPREIAAVHWVEPADLDRHVAPYTATMVRHVLDHGEHTAYLENSRPVGE